jgi:hypothetical protein
MRQTPALLIGFFARAALLVLTACSNRSAATSDAGPYGPCEPFTSDASFPASVSFGTDVAPIFQSNCTSGGLNCHGTRANRPYLGSADSGDDATTILESIVGVTAPEDPSMALVAPTDPVHSFLMHKLDGDQCTLEQGCANSGLSYLTSSATPCGNVMPNGATMLPVATRNTVRAWIAQGATNN